MNIVQFLLSAVNLLLALVVLFGGRFFMSKVSALQAQIDELKDQLGTRSEEPELKLHSTKPAEWDT